MLEDPDGLADFAPEAVEMRGSPGCGDPAVRVIEGLGEANPLLPVHNPLVECPTFSQGPRQPAPGHRGWKPGQPTPVTASIATEQLHDLLEKGFRLLIVTGREAECAEVVSRPNMEGRISERLGDGLSLLGGRTRVIRVSRAPEERDLVTR